MTCLFSFSDSRWQLSYMSIHFLQVIEAVLVNDVSMGIGQGCSAHFTICHRLPDTIAWHHIFPTNISWMSKFYPEKSSYQINKCMGKNLSFVDKQSPANSTFITPWPRRGSSQHFLLNQYFLLFFFSREDKVTLVNSVDVNLMFSWSSVCNYI